MLIDTDYIITREDTPGRLEFWGGRLGWTLVPFLAHTYKTRKLAELACKRNAWRMENAFYSTRDEIDKDYGRQAW